MLILVVEDSIMIQKLLNRKLSKQGWEVHMAENGQEGIEKARELKPDLILMDMHMPVMDGHEATRTLRAEGYTGRIAALTASVMAVEAESAINDGCDTLIAKPIDKTFIPRVREILGLDPEG